MFAELNIIHKHNVNSLHAKYSIILVILNGYKFSLDMIITYVKILQASTTYLGILLLGFAELSFKGVWYLFASSLYI